MLQEHVNYTHIALKCKELHFFCSALFRIAQFKQLEAGKLKKGDRSIYLQGLRPPRTDPHKNISLD